MTNQYVWIGITVGVFFAGIGIGYAVLQSTASPSVMHMTPQQMQQMMNDPQLMNQWHQQMMNNPQHMSQMMQPIMNTMMNDPQLQQQMLNNMMQHQGMMNYMMNNQQWQNMMGMNGTMMMSNRMMP